MFTGNLFCRTDSALKFGLFFLLYLVNITNFLLKCLGIMILHYYYYYCCGCLSLNLLCLQFHILFCVFAAVAPPAVFEGKSLA
jgi:hypothetical protein